MKNDQKTVFQMSSDYSTPFYVCWQALSASGLRALRYAREVEGIGQVVALDNDKGYWQTS